MVRDELSLLIYLCLLFIDKRLPLKARLFKTIGFTIGLLRIYSYNAKIGPVILTLLKIYAKNGELFFNKSLNKRLIF
jgi:hypothetical protein